MFQSSVGHRLRVGLVGSSGTGGESNAVFRRELDPECVDRHPRVIGARPERRGPGFRGRSHA